MPNTLAHIALQSLLTRPVFHFPGLFTAILLGVIIPDIPWIIQRLIRETGVPVDPYMLRAYTTIQATLIFSWLLSAACALTFQRVRLAWFVMSAGSLIHLIMDASEKKWANGVHFLAPFSWTHFNWGVVWPEHWLVWTMSAAGILTFSYFVVRTRHASAGLCFTVWRGFGSALILVIYLIAPLWNLDGPFGANNHYITTLSNNDERDGKEVSFDRAEVFTRSGEWYVRTFADEELALGGSIPERPGVYSLKGVFVTASQVNIVESHFHDGARDYLSALGTFLILAWLIMAFLGIHIGRRAATNSGN